MRWPIIAAFVAVILASGAAVAQEKEPYQPGLGEIMALQQMRHIKLWFAGHAGNWPLADYEIGELKEGFEDVAGLLGGEIVEQHVEVRLPKLRSANRKPWLGQQGSDSELMD